MGRDDITIQHFICKLRNSFCIVFRDNDLESVTKEDRKEKRNASGLCNNKKMFQKLKYVLRNRKGNFVIMKKCLIAMQRQCSYVTGNARQFTYRCQGNMKQQRCVSTVWGLDDHYGWNMWLIRRIGKNSCASDQEEKVGIYEHAMRKEDLENWTLTRSLPRLCHAHLQALMWWDGQLPFKHLISHPKRIYK